jgi:uncharacterized protein (DUF305 family)
MQRIVWIMSIGVVALLVGGCGAMSGGSMSDEPMAGMDHGTMDHSNMMSTTQTITDTMLISGTRTMSDTQMGDMDHSMMSVNPDQPFDAQFIDGMLEHHRGAVAMAEQALEQAEHSEVRTLAEAIIAAQTQEIEEMTDWRENWYPGLASTGGLAMNMGEMSISRDESKPFDQRFIEAMISHHQGAIEMAKLAQQMGEHAEIKRLADAIITAQAAEIEQMTGWLQEWFSKG